MNYRQNCLKLLIRIQPEAQLADFTVFIPRAGPLWQNL